MALSSLMNSASSNGLLNKLKEFTSKMKLKNVLMIFW